MTHYFWIYFIFYTPQKESIIVDKLIKYNHSYVYICMINILIIDYEFGCIIKPHNFVKYT